MGGGSLKGDLLCVVAVLFICASQLVARRVAQAHGSAAAVSALQLTVAALFSLLVLVTFERPPGYQDARKRLGDVITAGMFLLEGFEPDRAPHSGS